MRPARPTALALLLVVVLAPAAAETPLDAFVPRCAAPPATQDDAGSGRDASPADPVSPAPGPLAGCVDAQDTQDAFRYALAAGERLRATLAPERCSQFELSIGPASSPGTGFAYQWSGPCGRAVVSWEALAASDWLVRVRLRAADDAGEAQPYALDVQVGEGLVGLCGGTQDDAGSGRDATSANPAPLAAPGGVGCLDGFDARDVYAMTLPPGTMVRARVAFDTDDCGGAHILLRSLDRAESQWRAPDSLEASCAGYEVGLGPVRGGAYVLDVDGESIEARYAVDLLVGDDLPRACADAASDASPAAPVTLAEGALAGCVDVFDHVDVYLLDVPAGRASEVAFVPAVEDDACVRLRVARSASATGTHTQIQDACGSVVFTTMPEGADRTYRFEVLRHRGEGAYGVTAALCAAPGVTVWARGDVARVPLCALT